MRSKHPLSFYRSSAHLAATIGFIVLPFLFFLIFSKFFNLEPSVLFLDILYSFGRIAAAYVIAVLLAWGAAVLFYQGRRSIIALPVFDVLQSFPTFAALPLVAYLWGASSNTVIFFLVFTIIWPIFFSIISSLKLMRRDWGEVTAIYRVRGWWYLTKFLIPVTLPGLITGSVIGLGEGWEALVAMEIIVGAQSGLGNFFQMFSHNPTVTAFGILGFLILIFSINKLVWLSLLDWSHRHMEA